MNRAQRRAAAFKRGQRWDRNARVEPSAVLSPIVESVTYSPEQAAELTNIARMAWHRLTNGNGSRDDWDVLATTSNSVMVIAESLDALAVELAERSQAAILAMRRRYERTGRWGADAQALADVPPMLDAYHAIVSESSCNQMRASVREAQRRINAGIAA